VNCCDQDCHQGKDCPVRNQPAVNFSQDQIDKWWREDQAAEREFILMVGLAVLLVVVLVVVLIDLMGV
jgi:Tfp pilus assembly protein PilN